MSELVEFEDEELRREKYYREHYRRVYGAGGYPYEHHEQAYRYGRSVREDVDEAERDWMLVRTAARRGWEALYDRPWPEVEEAIRAGWREALERA